MEPNDDAEDMGEDDYRVWYLLDDGYFELEEDDDAPTE